MKKRILPLETCHHSCKRIAVVILLLFFCLMNETKHFAAGQEPSLFYLSREPKIKQEKPPLLILLHGVGSNEQDLFALAEYLPEQFLVVSARAPYTLGKDSYGWYEVDFSSGKPAIIQEQAEKSRLLLIAFIDELKTKYVFDEKQVFLCGFSQGAIMSYSAGLTRPDKIKGIALMSGRLLEEIKPLIRKDQLSNLTIYISHGTNDRVLGIHYAREAYSYLKQLGQSPVYKEYPEGHSINQEMLIDLVSWLKQQISTK